MFHFGGSRLYVPRFVYAPWKKGNGLADDAWQNDDVWETVTAGQSTFEGLTLLRRIRGRYFPEKPQEIFYYKLGFSKT